MHRLNTLPVWTYGLFLVVMLCLGIGAGFLVIRKDKPAVAALVTSTITGQEQSQQGTSAVTEKDLKTEDFRDSSTGTLLVKPVSDKKKQGTHILKRDDSPWPLYIISPVVDLTQYENKHVKIYGATYNGGTSDWYMTVNKVEEK